jgi:cell division septum initiation protein DivIVA
MPEFIEESVDIIGGGRELRAADPNATFENFQITEEFTPRQRVTRGQEVLAGGVVRPGERRETLASAVDVKRQAASDKLAADAEARLAANQESLALYRQAQAEAAQLRAENDQIKAQAAMIRANDLENNPSFGFVDVKRADGKTYRQYFQKNDPAKIVHEVDRGVMTESLFAPGATINVGSGASGGGLQNLAAMYGAKKPGVASGGTVPTLTVDQARTAPVGTIFLGTDGKRRQKNANGTVSIIE